MLVILHTLLVLTLNPRKCSELDTTSSQHPRFTANIFTHDFLLPHINSNSTILSLPSSGPSICPYYQPPRLGFNYYHLDYCHLSFNLLATSSTFCLQNILPTASIHNNHQAFDPTFPLLQMLSVIIYGVACFVFWPQITFSGQWSLYACSTFRQEVIARTCESDKRPRK